MSYNPMRHQAAVDRYLWNRGPAARKWKAQERQEADAGLTVKELASSARRFSKHWRRGAPA